MRNNTPTKPPSLPSISTRLRTLFFHLFSHPLIHILNHPSHLPRRPQINSRPTHPQRQNNGQNSRRDTQNENFLDSPHNRTQNLCLVIYVQRPQEGASDPRYCGLHVRPRDTREESCDGILSEIEEDGVGHGEGDGHAGDLGAGDEADRESDFLGRDEPLRDGKGRVDEEASSETAEDERGVDVCGAGGEGDVEKHGVGNDEEEAADEEPGEVVFEFFHEGAVERGGEDEGDDVGEEADAGLEGLVGLHELEVEGDEVDGDEGVCGSGCDLGEEDGEFFVGDVLDGEDAS